MAPGWLVALALSAALCGCMPPRVDPGQAYRSALWLPSVGPVALKPGALEGKVVLVKFLATWCLPCLTELASVIDLQRRYGGRDFTVVAVGLDNEGALVLEPFATLYELPFPLLVAGESIRAGTSSFGKVSALPTTYLLDRSGRKLLAYEGVAPPESLDALIGKSIKQ